MLLLGCWLFILMFAILGKRSAQLSYYWIFAEFFLELREVAMHDIIYDGTCVKKKKDLSPLF